MHLVQIHFQKIKVIYFYPFKSWIFCSNISFALTLFSSLWTIQSLQPPPSSGLLERFSKDAFYMEFTTCSVFIKASHARMVVVKSQLVGAHSLLSPGPLWALNSGCQAWLQVLLSVEPSYQLWNSLWRRLAELNDLCLDTYSYPPPEPTTDF